MDKRSFENADNWGERAVLQATKHPKYKENGHLDSGREALCIEHCTAGSRLRGRFQLAEITGADKVKLSGS